MARKNKKDTAEFLFTSFYDSKRSTKKIHKVNPAALYVLSYIFRSIDKHYNSKKRFETKLYQSQIAKYCHCSLDSVQRHCQLLVRKKLLKYDKKTFIYSIGNLFKAWSKLNTYRKLRQAQDIPQSAVGTRSTANCGTSNISQSSNSNDAEKLKSEKPKPTIGDKISINKKAKEAIKDIRQMIKPILIKNNQPKIRKNYDTNSKLEIKKAKTIF